MNTTENAAELLERIAALEARMMTEGRLSGVEVHHSYLATKSDIAEFRNWLQERDSARSRWMIGSIIATVASFAALLSLFFSLLDNIP